MSTNRANTGQSTGHCATVNKHLSSIPNHNSKQSFRLRGNCLSQLSINRAVTCTCDCHCSILNRINPFAHIAQVFILYRITYRVSTESYTVYCQHSLRQAHGGLRLLMVKILFRSSDMHRLDFRRFLGPVRGKTAGSFPEWVKPKPHLLREQIQFI